MSTRSTSRRCQPDSSVALASAARSSGAVIDLSSPECLLVPSSPAPTALASATPTFRNRPGTARIFARVLMRPNSAARVYGPAILTIALVVYAAAYLRWPSLAGQVDLQVYRFGAAQVLAGHDLYATGLTGNPRTLLFDYSPFAALSFLPLALVTPLTAQILGLAANAVLVAYVVLRLLRGAGLTAATGLWGVGALLIGLVAWLEPVRLSLQLGQVNL